MTNVTLVLFFKIAVFSDLWGRIVETTNPIFPSLGSREHRGEGGRGGNTTLWLGLNV